MSNRLVTQRRRAQPYVFVWVLFTILLTVQVNYNYDQIALVLLEGVLVFFGGSFTLSRVLRSGFWSPGNLFFIVLGLFHLGLIPFWIFQLDPRFPRPSDYVWFGGEIGVQALVIVLIAMAAYVLGTSLFVLLRPIKGSDADAASFVSDKRTAHYSFAGVALTLVGLVGWIYVGISAGGLGIFVGSYGSWLTLTADSTAITYAYLAIGIGLGLTVMAPAIGIVRFTLVLAIIFAAVAFFLGLRGEVLFPATVALSVLAFRRQMPRLWPTILGIVSALMIISAARVIRQLGVSDSSFDWADANPLSALAELGSTLRVVATTIIWHNVNGEQFRFGETYTASIVRMVESVVDPVNRPDGSTDFRLMNSEIAARAGGIGGSVVAEAFHNFAMPGTVIVFLLLGLLFGYFSNMNLTATRIALYVCAAVPLLNHVRNSFVPVIPAVLFGLIVLLAARVLGDIVTGERRRR